MSLWEARRQQQQDERDEHKKAMAKKYGVEGNRKLDKAYQLAWDFGHSSGLHEVELYFSDLATLIK